MHLSRDLKIHHFHHFHHFSHLTLGILVVLGTYQWMLCMEGFYLLKNIHFYHFHHLPLSPY